MTRSGSRMRMAVAFAVAGALLSACGDDSPPRSASEDTTPSAETPEETEPRGTEASPPRYEHPTGEDEVVVQYTELIGFPLFLRSFQAAPTATISGAGQYISAAPVAAVYPGPLVPAFQTRSISEEGIQTVLEAAEEAGLLSDVEYAVDPLVADANTASVQIAADGAEYRHDANALFLGGDDLRPSPFTPEEQTDRDALAGFILDFLEIEQLVGAGQLGEWEEFEPDAYVIGVVRAEELGAVTDHPDMVVAPWPTATGVVLAAVDGCVEAPASAVGKVFAEANEVTLFEEEGIVYRVAPIQKLPGRAC